MKVRALAVATDPVAEAAANEQLARGNAIDAVVAGVLAAAGEHAGVLLGPVQLLVGGAGVGLRAIDGRVRQPGRGTPRPRGVLATEEIPRPAFVGVPALPAALAAALASFGKSTVANVFATALERAKSASPERARVLERLARRGPSALAGAPIAEEIVAAAGRIAGGLVTEEDLAELRPATEACAVVEIDGRRVARVPWGVHDARDASAPPSSGAAVFAVAAADGRGALAVACYEVADAGVAIPALGLVAPMVAEPVRRAVVRVRPGEPRPASAPIALSERAAGIDLALAVTEREDAEHALDELLRAIASGTPVEIAAAALGGGRTIGVVRAEGGNMSAVGRVD